MNQEKGLASQQAILTQGLAKLPYSSNCLAGEWVWRFSGNTETVANKDQLWAIQLTLFPDLGLVGQENEFLNKRQLNIEKAKCSVWLFSVRFFLWLLSCATPAVLRKKSSWGWGWGVGGNHWSHFEANVGRAQAQSVEPHTMLPLTSPCPKADWLIESAASVGALPSLSLSLWTHGTETRLSI